MLSILGWSLIALIYVFLYYGVRATWRQFAAARRGSDAQGAAGSSAAPLKPVFG